MPMFTILNLKTLLNKLNIPAFQYISNAAFYDYDEYGMYSYKHVLYSVHCTVYNTVHRYRHYC